MKKHQKNFFITIEGIEGAGKSCQIEHIKSQLEDLNYQVIVTREPGGTNLGEDLRALLLGHQHSNMHPDTELLLMFAARAQHLQQVIIPALKAEKVVICDRFTDATYAYQGGGRGISLKQIKIMEDWVQKGLKPDLTLLFDLPIKMGLKRAAKRAAADRIESEKIEFFEKVRAAYLALAKTDQRFKIIDASQPLDDVTLIIKQHITDFLRQR